MPLLKFIERERGDVRTFAIDCFHHLRDPRAVEPLLKIVRARGAWMETFQRGQSEAAISALGNQRDARALPEMLAIMQGGTEDVTLRGLAAVAIGEISDPDSFELLVDKLIDRREPIAVRTGAAEGLGRFCWPAGPPPNFARHDAVRMALLIGMLNDETERMEVRMTVVEALARLKRPEAVEPLCRAAATRPNHRLGFWAAVTAVQITDGKVRNRAVASAIRNFRPNVKDDDLERAAQRDALNKLAANKNRGLLDAEDGSGSAVVALISVGIVALVAVILLRGKGGEPGDKSGWPRLAGDQRV